MFLPPATDRRCWASHSPMSAIPDAQTDANVAGRARVCEGLLSPSSSTRWLSAADYPRQDFVIVEDFLPAADCDALCAAFKTLHAAQRDRRFDVEFWDGRLVQLDTVAAQRPADAERMAEAQRRAAERLADFYALTRPLYADNVQLGLWSRNAWMAPHTDNAYPDGGPHESWWRDFSSIVYLNDDYQGGQLYFTALDAVLRPRKGMLVAFSAGFHHEHAVLRVKSGRRLTMPAFYSFDPTHADPLIHPHASPYARWVIEMAPPMRA